LATLLLISLLAIPASANRFYEVDIHVSVNRSPDGALQIASVLGTFEKQSISLVVTATGKPPVPVQISTTVGKKFPPW
jgi:hypothetical protein